MRHLVIKDFFYRRRFFRVENFYIILKACAMDQRFSKRFRYLFEVNLSNFRFSSRVRIRNRCILTGWSRSVLRPFRLSRIQFRRLSSYAIFYGIRKGSW